MQHFSAQTPSTSTKSRGYKLVEFVMNQVASQRQGEKAVQLRSKNTNAWEGEDEEGEEERGEEKRRRKPQRQAKEKFSPNVSETAKAGGLGDAGKNVEMIQQKERNRFSFRNGIKTTTMAKDRKLKSEEEIRQIMNMALQRQDKMKRKRKRGAKNFEKLEKREENILSVSEERTKFVEVGAIQRLDNLNSTFNAEAFELQTAYCEKSKEQMEAVHAELKAKHLSTKSFDLDGVKKYVSEIVKKARQKLLKEKTALQFLQVQESLMIKHGEHAKRILDIRKATEAVHEELLTLFTSGVRKPIIVYCKKAKAKREQMINVHKELKRQTFLKGLCIEDDDEDAGFLPRKLFLFGIEEFQKVPQVVLQPDFAQKNSVEAPSCSAEPVADQEEESEAPFIEKKRSSIGQRFLRFFGFR
uniref:Uncharacterized protein n=2 Tax=Magallana gigas TaxID=29159 RepID=A0A8W8K2L6_MAGGI